MTGQQIELLETYSEKQITPGNAVKQNSSNRTGVVVSMKEMATMVFEVMFDDGTCGLFKADEITTIKPQERIE